VDFCLPFFFLSGKTVKKLQARQGSLYSTLVLKVRSRKIHQKQKNESVPEKHFVEIKNKSRNGE
jgi:hypothetical protein